MDRVIYSGKFYTLFSLMVELDYAFKAAKEARTADAGGSLDEDEISFNGAADTVQVTEETLTDGSKVYNLDIL